MDVLERLLDQAQVVAEIRQRCAPAADDPAGRWKRCRDCHDPYWDWGKRGHRRCPQCAGVRLIEINLQRSRRSGPKYVATVRAQLQFWLKEADRLGITPEGEQ